MKIHTRIQQTPGASIRKAVPVFAAVLMCFHGDLTAQVISNTGASISVSSGTVIGSRDLENTSGSIGNNGTIDLSGNYYNEGITGGNGFYILKGNWTNYGTFNPDTSHVTLAGPVNQLITHGSSGETFYKLTLNNPALISQVSGAGGSLTILNDIALLKGTLGLGPTTSNLAVGGRARIDGNLRYDNITAQAAAITGSLSGAGTIDMSGGDLPHFLYLAGETNQIGTFTTSPSGPSTVNYNGTGASQTVFPADNYRHLIISNSGIKTLQGNSRVGLDLTVSGGTFDLGTVTTSLEVSGNTLISDRMNFNGTSLKNVSMWGNLSGTGALDMSGGDLGHNLYLDGTMNSIGSYASGAAGTVYYTRDGDQTVFMSDDYRNLTIIGDSMKTMTGDVTAKGVLTMSAGSIDAGLNTLFLSNPAIAALARTDGTIIGKFQRAAGFTSGEYLYPVGSFTTYNPLKITFDQLSAGPLAIQYRQEDIGDAGLPLDDDGNEIHDRFTTGYWSLTSVSPMATGSFNVSLNFDGFTGVDLSSSIIKRTNGGNLELDGVHGSVTASEITRTVLVNGITTTDLGIGRGRPRIVIQPENIDICETFDAFFELRARGRGNLSYQWQVSVSGGPFTDLTDGGVYSNTHSDHLDITAAPYSMNGYEYRCVITDQQGHSSISSVVLLTVNKIPVAVASPVTQDICPGANITPVLLTTANDVPGTTFTWRRNNPAGLSTALPITGTAVGDRITGALNNTTDSVITVRFAIVPTGPGTTFCVGDTIYAWVNINPTPRVIAVPQLTTQCDSTETSIQLRSPSRFTTGVVTFRYSVTSTGDVDGYTTPSFGIPNYHYIEDLLVNHTDSYQTVTYRITAQSPVPGCPEGSNQAVSNVIVNPTPRALPVNSWPSICDQRTTQPDSKTTQIRLESPTTMTSGSIIFDYTVSLSDPGYLNGNTTPRTGLPEFTNINYNYTNTSDTIQSVYYIITPRNNAICPAGPEYISEVKVHAMPIQDFTITKSLVCATGSGLGEITVTPSEGAGPYEIEWYGPNQYHMLDSFLIRNLTGGSYTATVTDNLGCQSDSSDYLVPEFAQPYMWIKPLRPYPGWPGLTYNLSCAGSGDASITIGVDAGITPPYDYWFVKNETDTLRSGTFASAGSDVRRVVDSLGYGRYSLIIRDVNNCIVVEPPRALRVPPPIEAVIVPKKYGDFNISCKGFSDGAAWIESISGGWGEYTYRWYTYDGNIPGRVDSSGIVNISAGRYYLEVRDIMAHNDTVNCPKIFMIDIVEPDGMELDTFNLSLSADGNNNISCNGGNDGRIDITVKGGSGEYIYLWTSSNGYTSTSEDISGLKAGTYSCLVKDILNPGPDGCYVSPLPTFTLTEPAPIVISADLSQSTDGAYEINCNGGNGSIDITVTGGSTGNYTYAWTGTGSGIVQGLQDQTALTAGTYNLVVTDMNGCSDSIQVTLDEPPVLALQLFATHITCAAPGFDNGAVNLTASGGAGSYSYLWSNGSISEDISGLTEGIYQVNVTYNNTCTKSESIRINLPPALTYTSAIRSYNSYEISCYGMADGQISITPTTGKAPFDFTWTGPNGFTSKSPVLTGRVAGDYNLTIVDSNFCRVDEVITLREPGPLGVTFDLSAGRTAGFNIDCAGDSTGSITVNPINSVNSVQYIWEDGFTTRTRTNLGAGDYPVAIVDDNGCTASATATLREPDSIKLEFDIHKPFCPDMPDGEIRLTSTGGIVGTGYEYRWSNGETGSTISNILRGYYSVSVEDLNGCVVKDSVYVEPVNSSCLRIPNIISPNNDLINDEWNIGLVNLYPEMEVKIFNRWGENIWKSEKGYPRPWDGTSNGRELPVDSYHYIIELNNGSKPVVGNITIVR